MKLVRQVVPLAVAAIAGVMLAAQATPPRKKVLVIGEEKGYRHEAVSRAMVTIERLGKQSGLWDTVIRTDTEALTKKKLEYNAKNLIDFDAVVFIPAARSKWTTRRRRHSCRSRRRQGLHRHPERSDHVHAARSISRTRASTGPTTTSQ
jgi:hypothetical protein